ncbi:hypothetical protein H4R26_006221, partial [Coemansia thaxteri]
MSRFFRHNESSDSDSESSSSSSDGDFSDEELQQQQQKQTSGGAAASGSRFARAVVDSDDSDDEDVKRTVRSTKDKLADQVVEHSREMLRAIRADEWHAAAGGFDQLNKVVPKFIKSATLESVPRAYVRALAALEDALYDHQKDKAAMGKLSATDSRGYNQLKQRVRKHNRDFAELIADFRANPTESDDEEVAEAGEDRGEGEDQTVPSQSAAAPAKSAAKRGKAADSDSDGSDWNL